MSYIEVSSQSLKRACENYLRARKERILAEREKLIDKEMEGVFFGLIKPSSREKARKRLEEDTSLFSEWEACSDKGFHWKCKVQELLSATNLTNSVTLDVEMANVLKDFWPQ